MVRCPKANEGRIVEEIRRARMEFEKQFRDRHGYMPAAVPETWVGARVALNVLTGVTGGQLGVAPSSGFLSGINDDGYVISNEGGKVVFLPKQAVMHIELYDEGSHGGSMAIID
jgi:hypothetical protein